MATTSKYFVVTPIADNLDFLDFGLNYGSVTTVGETIQYSGSAKVDSVFVRPGLTYDLTNTAAGTDKIYFTGNLSDYSRIFDTSTQTLTLTRTVNGLTESAKVYGGTPLVFDNIIFANGYVSANALYSATANATALPIPNVTETSLAPQGAAAPGASLNASIKAYSTNTAAAGQVGETFASTKPGISLTIFGGNGIDTVYVADGEVVDATVTGASVDLIYFRGNWADYTKSVISSGTKLLFTRVINGATESVTVTAGTPLNFDRLIFADGTITTIDAKNLLIVDPTSPGPVDPSITTPLYTDEEVLAAINAIRDAAQANNAGTSTPSALTYKIAGVTGVDASNLAAMNSALNSLPIDGNAVDTTPEIQTLVNAYRAILTEANGAAANPNPLLTSTPYTNVGVTGVSGTPIAGNALFLLDDVLDHSSNAAVDTVPELQAMADAAARVIAAAGGTSGQAAALTQTDLTNLGITGVGPGNIAAIDAAIQASSDSAVDTQAEIQALVNLVGVGNHAPVLDASKSPSLGTIDTTTAAPTPVGAVGTLVSSLVNTTGIANFSDVDPGTMAGMAITGYNTTAGTLYYSTNNGTTWTAWTPSSNLGLHLLADSSTRIYFKPVTNTMGDAAISFEAWDHSNSITNGGIAAITATGGSTAYSSTADSIGYSLIGVYTPIFPSGTSLTSIVASPTDLVIANYNGDGFMDLTMGLYWSPTTQPVRLGTANGISTNPTDSNQQSVVPAISAYAETASALDFNGDGYADIALGDSTIGFTVNRGIYFGNSFGTTNDSLLSTTWTGNSSGGIQVAKGAGDYNGDGYQDFFSATINTGYAGLVYGNAAKLFTYDSTNANVGVTFGTGAAGFAAAGSETRWFDGTAAAYLGDTNCDGLADVAFSNYLTGTVYVKFGTASLTSTQAIDASTVGAATGKGFVVSGLSTTLLSNTGYTSGPYENVGVNVASAGDVNGDGYADLLIMSPGNSSAYVVYGKPNGSVADVNVASMTASQGFKISVSNNAWQFGWNGASAGDVNGDGYSDLVIGEPGRTTEGAIVVVFGGATGSHADITADTNASSGGWATTITFPGLTAYNDFPQLVERMGGGIGSSAGDINGDGLSDFAIGAQGLTWNRPVVIYGDTNMTSLSLNPLIQGSLATGTTAAERVLGTSGTDTLSGGGGADAISAGAGIDTVLIHDASFLHLDGGLGTDTLKLDATASGVNLDFTANGLGGKIAGFEGIDLTGGGNNSLKLTVQDVLQQGNNVNTSATSFNEAHLLVVSGNAGDSLTVSSTLSPNPGAWTIPTALSFSDRSALNGLGYQFVAGDSYSVYTNGLATLIVDNAVSFQVV